MTTAAKALNARREWITPWMRSSKLLDAAVIVAVFAYAFLFYLGRVRGDYPLITLGGDGANIASWAAAWDHPASFARDSVLSNPDNFRFYQIVQIPLIRFLASINGGNYSLAYASLIGPQIFLYVVGFYILGQTLFGSRYWGFLFAFANSGYFALNLGEYWGFHVDPQPRFMFQAFLPYVLILAVRWRSHPARWPWLILLAGLLMYVHPVSAPVWGFTLWLGLWPFHPPSWSLRKRIGVMLLLGITFVAIALPFLVNYFQSRPQGTPQNYSQVYSVLQTVYVRDVLDVPYAAFNFIAITTKQLLLPVAIVSAVLVWRLNPDRGTLRLIAVWLLGIILISIVIPSIEQRIEKSLEILPLQIDLVRGLRYIVPVMLVFCVWPFALISKRLKHRPRRIAFGAFGAILLSIWLHWHPPHPNIISLALSCLQSGNLVCNWDPPNTLQLLEAVKQQTAPNATIMPSFGENTPLLMLRYGALRSLVFAQKDRALFGYNVTGQDMLRWNTIFERARDIQAMQDDSAQLRALVDLSRELGAQYLVILNDEIDPSLVPALSLQVVFTNDVYSLIPLT